MSKDSCFHRNIGAVLFGDDYVVGLLLGPFDKDGVLMEAVVVLHELKREGEGSSM